MAGSTHARLSAVNADEALLSLEEACTRYMLTVDEFLSWQLSIHRFSHSKVHTALPPQVLIK
jgi:hypothetical protein